MEKRTYWLLGAGLAGVGLLTGVGLLAFGHSNIPKNATPVYPFQIDRYLGTWHEIARFDYRFEKNLTNVTAEYRLAENGTIKVTNRGFDQVSEKWKSAEGKAKFRGDEQVAALKVSFFGPFYTGYNVIELDKDYQYALVAGKNLDYLWILSRTDTLPDEIRQRFLEKAEEVGYDVSKLIWVTHDPISPRS